MSRPTETPRHPCAGDCQLMLAAMDWLVRLHGSLVFDGELAEWALWYEADERHQWAFEQLQRLWVAAGALADGPDGSARVQRLLASPPRADARRGNGRGLRVALAASAAAGALGLAWLSHRFFHARRAVAAVPLVRQMTLPDGTSVQLAPGTRIAVRYTAARRRVALIGGEAFFTVRHNSARPFLVMVNGLTVRDEGTAFDVHEAAGRAVVTVVRGKIEVSGVRVSAAEAVKWGRHGRLVVKRADTGRALAWRQGRLEYIDEPLSSVIADVNRYTRHPVVIRDKAVGRIAFTGTVFARYAAQWVRALPGEFPVRLVSRDGRSFVLERRPENNP